MSQSEPTKPIVMRSRTYEWRDPLDTAAQVGSMSGLEFLIGIIEGRLARFVYTSLYRMHLIAIHGWLKGLFLILMGHVNQVVRPKLKLH